MPWIQRTPMEQGKRMIEALLDGHMVIRRVRHCGEIKFRGRLLFLPEVLAVGLVALEEVEDGIWRILLYGTELARLDERSWKLIPLSGINRLEL